MEAKTATEAQRLVAINMDKIVAIIDMDGFHIRNFIAKSWELCGWGRMKLCHFFYIGLKW